MVLVLLTSLNCYKSTLRIILCVDCFGGTVLCMCIECRIWVGVCHVSAQGVDERMINAYYYYYYYYYY